MFTSNSIFPYKWSTLLLLIGVLFLIPTSNSFANSFLSLAGSEDILMLVTDTNALQASNDFEIITNHQRKNPYPAKKKPSFLLVGKKNIVKYNPVSLLFGGMLFTYQAFISSQIAADCPYEVSCSAFSKQSIQEFGLIKGLALSADRLTRCTKSSVKHIHPLRLSESGNIIDFPSYYRIKNCAKE